MSKSSQNRVGIVAIARELGISTTTVHAALTGSAPVAKATQERVRNTAAALGYHPNLHARTLRTKKSHLIGMIARGLRRQFFGQSFETIDVIADADGYTLLQASSHKREERERSQCETFLGLAADGLIIVGGLCSATFYNTLTPHIPMLFISDMPEGVQADCVVIDDYHGGYLAGEHMARIGRRKIVYFAPSREYLSQGWVRERLSGCTDALREAGVAAPTVIAGPPPERLDLPGSQRTFGAALATGLACDGVVAANDHLGYGALSALQGRGLRVPDDVAVIGYDDIEMPPPGLPSLTTIANPLPEIGVQSMYLLLRRISGEETGAPKVLRVPPTLVKRYTA